MAPERTPTIGLLTAWLDDSYHLMILYGALDAAREYDARLICFISGVGGAELPAITQDSSVGEDDESTIPPP